MARKLSPKQKRILDYIADFLDEHQYPPTVRDIQYGCEISSTSVVDYNLRILQREGHLTRQPDVSRGIELLDGQRRSSRSGLVPVPVMGNIAAGDPLPLPPSSSWRDEGIDSVDLPQFMTKGKDNVYAVRVQGQSMIDALVADGDLVLLEPALRAESGDMVAAMLKDEESVTLKRFYMEGSNVRLQPANTTMDPIVVSADRVAVQGKVVGVIRTI